MLLAINLQANNERFNFDGGQIYLSGGATEIEVCSGDGIADELDITRVNWEGMWTYWVITNPEGIILSIVDELPLDFEGAGAGVCLVWHLAVKDFTSDFEVGMHKDEVTGWLDYSNEITVTRTAVAAASIDVNGATELETCVGDGISDAFTVSYDGGAGTYSKWIITDEDLNILALQTSATFDLEGAGPGTCLIWRMTYNSIAGNVVGLNAGNLIGCFALSNPITVVRGTPESAEIALENGEISLDICAGDGISDSFTPVLTGGAGENNAWIITDPDLNIIGLPEGPSFDLEGAGEGVCLL